jgi:hypothetical protein
MATSPWLPAAKGKRWHRTDAREIPATAVQPGDSFLVAVEGKVTEPVYFTELRAVFSPGIIHLIIVPAHGGCAVDVVQKVVEAREDRSLRRKLEKLGYAEVMEFDHCWAVFDTDHALADGTLAPALQMAQKEGILLAPSTPCFEFWLFLHLRYGTPVLLDYAAAAALLTKELGRRYAKSEQEARKLMPEFMPKIAQAVRHARRVRQHHIDGGSQPPANPSTNVDLLVSAINSAAPIPYRLEGI